MRAEPFPRGNDLAPQTHGGWQAPGTKKGTEMVPFT